MQRLLILFSLFLPLPALAATDTIARQAYLEDFTTGTPLLAKDAETQMHPSSMSKLMTLYVLFQRLHEGKLHLTDRFTVSEKAWRTQGSKSFVPIGGTIDIEDLIRGIIIQSGNDACIVIAEGISGSEDAFVQEMNAVGKTIGLNNSHFDNATGLPDDKHLMSAHDLARLARHIITDFPEFYHYFSEKEFTFNNITQGNRNTLLGNDIGVDGLKTGHTDAGGYGITLSAKDPKSGRRVILVVNGLQSAHDRIAEGDRLLRYGLREFENRTLLKAGQEVETAPVWFGTQKDVKLVAQNDAVVTLPVTAARDAKFTLTYTSPLPAPIAKGAELAQLHISMQGQPDITVPLVAEQDVPALSGFAKLWAKLKYKLHLM